MSRSSLSSILPSPPASERKGPRLLTPTTNAIPFVSVKHVRDYCTLHTVAVVVLFLLQFRALVADPYRIMLWDLCLLILLQSAYCVACLPPTGTWANTTTHSSGNEAAGSGSGKNKGSGVGSMRKRPVGLGRTGAASGGWKGKAMVLDFNSSDSRSQLLMKPLALAYDHCSCPSYIAASNPTDSARTRPWRPSIPDSSHPQHSRVVLTHLTPHLYAPLLLAWRLGTSMARCHCGVVTLRRTRGLGR